MPDWSKVGKHSRRKGAAFENAVIKEFLRHGWHFVRTHTIQYCHPKEWHGVMRWDLVPQPDEIGLQIVLACRNRRGCSVSDALQGRPGPLVDWLNELLEIREPNWQFAAVTKEPGGGIMCVALTEFLKSPSRPEPIADKWHCGRILTDKGPVTAVSPSHLLWLWGYRG